MELKINDVILFEDSLPKEMVRNDIPQVYISVGSILNIKDDIITIKNNVKLHIKQIIRNAITKEKNPKYITNWTLK